MTDETTTGPVGSGPDVRDLLPGYALDALDESDRRAVDRLLEADSDARRALDEYREVAAAFAAEADPPPSLRDSVLARVRVTPQIPLAASGEPWPSETGGDAADPPVAPRQPDVGTASGQGAGVVSLDAVRARRRRRWGAAIASVAAAAAIAVPTMFAVQLTTERDQLQQQVEAVSEMLADPDSAILRAAVDGGGEASVLVSGEDMFFHAEGLPDPGQGQAYQLWVVGKDGGVSSAGLLDLRDGEASSLVRASDGVGMAVSVEPDVGSEQPTSAPIVVLGA